jgi:hypothetical protein
MDIIIVMTGVCGWHKMISFSGTPPYNCSMSIPILQAKNTDLQISSNVLGMSSKESLWFVSFVTSNK